MKRRINKKISVEQKLRKIIKEEYKKLLNENNETEARAVLNPYIRNLKKFNPTFKIAEGSETISYYYELNIKDQLDLPAIVVDYSVNDKFDNSRSYDDGEVYLNIWVNKYDSADYKKDIFEIIQEIKKININIDILIDDGWISIKANKIKTIHDLESRLY